MYREPGPADPQQAPLAALARLHAYQTAHTSRLRKAMCDNAPLEVVQPLTAEALTLLSTAKLLTKVRMMPRHSATGSQHLTMIGSAPIASPAALPSMLATFQRAFSCSISMVL